MDTKVCASCAVPRPVDNYYPAPGNLDYLASRCIRCAVIESATPIGDFMTSAEYRAGNRQAQREKAASQLRVSIPRAAGRKWAR